MPSKRDLLEKSRQNQAKKADVKPRYRSVICAADGSRSTGSQWADEDTKVVYHQLFGSGGIGRAKCVTIANPELGLGVEVSKIDDRLAEWEVVSDDPFLRRSATDARNYGVTSPQDLLPGGRLMLWVDSRQITPLSTYDTPDTLQVNVVSGDYPYLGTRKTFAGSTNQDLTSRAPGAGLTRLVGLYLDSANSLQFVNGSTVAIGLNPPEPTWPAGAFRLSVVQLDNAQTSLAFGDDIFDRRMIWSDEQGGSAGGWPLTHVLTVSTTNANADYTTLAAAITAASTGDVILADAETFTENITIDKAIALIGHPGGTIINSTGSASTNIVISLAGAYIGNLILTNSGTGLLSTCITWNVNNVTIKDVICTKTGAATTGTALYQYGGTGAKLINVEATASGATSNYAYRNDTADSGAEIRGGSFSGTTQDIFGNRAGSALTLVKPILVNQLISWSGTINGSDYIGHGVGVYNSGDLTITNATDTALTFDSERWDTNGYHSTSSNTSRLTVPGGYGGRYAIFGNARFDTNATGSRAAYILLNGATVIAIDVRVAVSGRPGDVVLSTVYPLVVGDYVELFAFQDSGGNLAVKSVGNFSPEFRMEKLS